jgi:hypothetical protein
MLIHGADEKARAYVRAELRRRNTDDWWSESALWARSYVRCDLGGRIHPATRYGAAVTMRLANLESNRKARP